MSCIIQLTYRAKRSLSQNPTRQLPHKFTLPKLSVDRQRAISFDRCTQNKKPISNSPKPHTQSPKIIAKSVQTDFNHLKLSLCSKQSVVLEGNQFKSTIKRKLKQLPINSNDFCYAGFKTTDTEYDDFSLEAYLKRQ
ncbi:unnamed protein product [Paramecium primaurelia]|uniref:Uncharacterized protein n=1 Tax=Paramecium primaurelia TaxID=5886 RepID=A0A8S1NEN8_PARPR|nr:unnamed protein product [Paramecium primaurelia]